MGHAVEGSIEVMDLALVSMLRSAAVTGQCSPKKRIINGIVVLGAVHKGKCGHSKGIPKKSSAEALVQVTSMSAEEDRRSRPHGLNTVELLTIASSILNIALDRTMLCCCQPRHKRMSV